MRAGGDVRSSPCIQPSVGAGSPSSTLAVVGYEWVRDDVLKYRSTLTSSASFVVFQRQEKLANAKDSCKLAVQTCGSDDFPFLRVVPSFPSFFFMYRCLFQVLGVIFPLTVFQCALLEHLNVALSQLHPNSWATVKAFEILSPFFNIRPSVLVFLFFFQMKLSGKIGWVSLNSVSKKLFEFD